MIIIRRTFHSSIKSLLHFDYPYYGETGDALRDEIGAYSWGRNGSVKFVGTETPNDSVVSGTPKFGYRCLQSASTNDYVSSSGTWTLNSSGSYEVSCWVRPTASQTGNIFALFNGNTQVLALSLDSSLKLQANCATLSLSLSATSPLSLNTWHFIRLQISTAKAAVLVGGTTAAEGNISRVSVTATQARIGGFCGQVDEFAFRTTLTDTFSDAPTQGALSLTSVGGTGSGKLGSAVLTSGGQFNTQANISTISGKVCNLSSISTGKFGGFAINDEVMLINTSTGDYDFRTITAVNSSTSLTLNTNPPTGANVIVQVPHFNTLTVNAGVTMTGRYIVFRCKGNCTVNGKLITRSLSHPGRSDSLTMTHAQLIDRFLVGRGGGVWIVCGGTFSAPSSARIGSEWSGTQTPTIASGVAGSGAGYGGSTHHGSIYPGQVGRSGYFPAQNIAAAMPGREPSQPYSTSGSCVVLITKTLSVDAAAISTGGENGNSNNDGYYNTGGGTGFCYIACERMI